MRPSTQFKPTAAATIAFCLPIAGIMLAGDAEARRLGYVKPYYSETYETDRPARGYEGFLFPDYYCSYKRFPNRVCNTDKRGRETCRIRGWRLEQTCQ